jgi:hypothetical protein
MKFLEVFLPLIKVKRFLQIPPQKVDWKAGGHTPRLASVKFVTVKKRLNRSSDRGMAPANTINFLSNEDTLGLTPGYIHFRNFYPSAEIRYTRKLRFPYPTSFGVITIKGYPR